MLIKVPKKILIVVLIGIMSLTYIVSKYEAPKDEPAKQGLDSIDPEGDGIISGKIIEIKNNGILLDVGGGVKNVMIIVDDNSRIYKMNQKEEDRYKKEIEQFSKKMQEQMETPSISVSSEPPSVFISEDVSVDGLLADQQVQIIIEAEGDNLRAKEVFVQ